MLNCQVTTGQWGLPERKDFSFPALELQRILSFSFLSPFLARYIICIHSSNVCFGWDAHFTKTDMSPAFLHHLVGDTGTKSNYNPQVKQFPPAGGVKKVTLRLFPIPVLAPTSTQSLAPRGVSFSPLWPEAKAGERNKSLSEWKHKCGPIKYVFFFFFF